MSESDESGHEPVSRRQSAAWISMTPTFTLQEALCDVLAPLLSRGRMAAAMTPRIVTTASSSKSEAPCRGANLNLLGRMSVALPNHVKHWQVHRQQDATNNNGQPDGQHRLDRANHSIGRRFDVAP